MKRFRVYDLKNKRYVYDDEFVIKEGLAVGYEDYPLEQASGINDINGDTIYENDKLFIEGKVDGHAVSRECVVKKKRGCFVINIFKTNWYPLFIASKHEIIKEIRGPINDG